MITCMWKVRRREESRGTLEVTSLGSYLFRVLVTEKRDAGGRTCLGRKEINPFYAVIKSHLGRDFWWIIENKGLELR